MDLKSVEQWAAANDTLPILRVEMAQSCTLVELQYKKHRPEECYVWEFCGAYRRVITALVKNGLTRGKTLREMVKTSLLAAKAYARSSSDCKAQIDHIHQRMSVDTWDALGRRLENCMTTIASQAKDWTVSIRRGTSRPLNGRPWSSNEHHSSSLMKYRLQKIFSLQMR